MPIMYIFFIIIGVCAALFITNVLGKRERALEVTKLITVLKHMDNKLPITQNSYLFLDEKNSLFFYLDDELLEAPSIYYLKNRRYFYFDNQWENTIINAILQKLKEIDQKAIKERKEKRNKFIREKEKENNHG